MDAYNGSAGAGKQKQKMITRNLDRALRRMKKAYTTKPVKGKGK